MFNLCSLAISAAELPRSAGRVTLGDISGPAPGFGEEPIPSLHLTVPGCRVGEAMLLSA
jgi:hypothetical protein